MLAQGRADLRALKGPGRLWRQAPKTSSENYEYDEIGNLVRDSSEQIEKIVWTVQGKVQEVHFEAGKPGPSVLQYEYDPMGNRLAKKKLYVDGPVDIRSEGQYYVRDPQGNVLAVYQYNEENIALVDDKDSLYLEELHLYGSARLGILKKPLFLRFRNESGHTGGDEALAFRTLMGVAQSSYQQLELGRRRYELSNHLGNVLATVSDKSLGQDSSQTGQADYYLAQVSSASLYYPFGWEMPGRKFVSGEGCRFGFNGKEDDRDWGTQNIQDYGFRLYNPSIGKFLSVDPLAKSFPWNSCYAFAEGDVVRSVDLDGLEKEFYYTMDKGQKPILKSVSYGDSPMDSEGNREVHVVDYFDDLGYKLGQAVHHSVDELESYDHDEQFGNRIRPMASGRIDPVDDPFTGALGGGLGLIDDLVAHAVGKITAKVGAKLLSKTLLKTSPKLPDQVVGAAKKGFNSKKTGKKASNKLRPDKSAEGDHTTFKRDDYGKVFKYETYEKTRTGHYNPVKRYDGGKPNGQPGADHNNKYGEPIPTPHVQGKGIPEGVRPPEPWEIPK